MSTASAVLCKCSTGRVSTLRGGTWWSCRQGTTHHEPHAWSSKYACKIAAHYMRRSASIRRRVRRRRGAEKKCPSGYKPIGVSKSCYNCHGWKRSTPFSAHGSKACFRWVKLQLFRATLHGNVVKQCRALGQRACTVIERGPDACDNGLSRSLRPNKASLKFGSFSVCLPKVNKREFVRNAKRNTLKEAEAHEKVVGVVFKCVSKKRGVLLLGRNYLAIADIVHSCMGTDFQLAVKNLGFHTLTVGVTSQAGVGVHAVTEIGAAINLRKEGDVMGYSALGYQYEFAAGANVGVALGFAKNPPNKLLGNGHGVAFGASTKVVIDVGGGIGIDYNYDGQVERYVHFAGGCVGIGLPISGACYRDTTVVFR